MSDETFVSAHSGETFPESERIEVAGLGSIARAEMDAAGVVVCADRGTYHRIIEMYGVSPGGRLVCSAAMADYFTCTYYQEWYHFSTRVRVRGGYGPVTRDALVTSGGFFQCSDCGHWFHHDSEHRDHEGVCVDCGNERNCRDDEDDEDSGDDVIFDHYNTRFPPKRGKGPLYMGVELEVEVKGGSSRADQARRVRELLGADFVIIKEDGSLDNGFEIVSCPAEPALHRHAWDPLFASRKGLLSAKSGTCGMHVHVSRDALSCLQLGKMLVFVNRPEHKAFIQKVANRCPDHWAKVVPKKISDERRAPDTERYRAINTTPSRTVEFRIFNGTLTRDRFLSNLEFVEALVEFTAPAARSIVESADLQAYLKFVEKHRKRWPHHYHRMVCDGFLRERPRKPDAVATPAPAVTPPIPQLVAESVTA